jgi:hypothetical protein
MYHHRPGKQRQDNKSHKVGTHATKRAIDKAKHGRVEKAGAAGGAAGGAGGGGDGAGEAAIAKHRGGVKHGGA